MRRRAEHRGAERGAEKGECVWLASRLVPSEERWAKSAGSPFAVLRSRCLCTARYSI